MSARIFQTLKKHPAVSITSQDNTFMIVHVFNFFKVVPVFVITVGGAAFAGMQILRASNYYTDVS